MVAQPPLSQNEQGVKLVVSMWIEFAITTVVIAARVYTRGFYVRSAGWDDLLMLIAFVSYPMFETVRYLHGSLKVLVRQSRCLHSQQLGRELWLRYAPVRLGPRACHRGSEVGFSGPDSGNYGFSNCENGFHRDSHSSSRSRAEVAVVDAATVVFWTSCYQLHYVAVYLAAV
jgi:hypothetical protein